MQEKTSDDDISDEQKESQILCADSIANYKTVASFGHDERLLNLFDRINQKKAAVDSRASLWYSLTLGFSTGINNGIFAVFYWASGELNSAYPTYEYCEMRVLYIAMFMIIFGAFTAATSFSMGPDITKAKRAAIKIFTIMRTPSKVDAMADNLK